jgi:phenylacetate-CoA ligase
MQGTLDPALAATIAYARAHSPFYRKAFSSIAEVHTAADFSRLPLTSKQQVSQFNRAFWSVPPDRIVDICTTSGTTGEPTLYPLTQSDLTRLARNEFLCFSAAGVKPGDTVLLAVTIDKCFMAGLAYFEGLRSLGATAVRVGAGSPAMLLSMMQRLGPTAIVSVPSFLRRVAQYARQHDMNLAQSSVRKLICIGEPVRDSDWKLTALGESIAHAWSASVHSTYGVTELACSFCECEASQGGHLLPELLHAEVLDETGLPVPDGQTGQLVATTIGVEGMPLIRFATGDITFMTRTPCACGRSTPRIGPILGRKDQMMKIKGTTVFPAAVQRALQGIEQVLDYVMIASAPTPMSDELEVFVAVRDAAGDLEEMICEKLRGELKVSPRVRLMSPREMQDQFHSNELRKQRVFIDRRPRQG